MAMKKSLSLFLLALSLLAPLVLFSAPLDQKVKRDFELLDLPTRPWRTSVDDTIDVAVIGAGMSGVAITAALKLDGIDNVQLFDANDKGLEGPWHRTARMKTLRSGKSLRGPSLGLPHLTFRAWYEAKYGKEEWEKLGKIPTDLWGRYLQWLRRALNIEVNNGCRLISIVPNIDSSLHLIFEGNIHVNARKVVLSTGRGGFGGWEVPEFMQGISKKFWAHTGDEIDPKSLTDKRVIVVGVGASAFDAAAVALENGAKSVQMLMRRKELPLRNLLGEFAYPGFRYGFFFLPDDEKISFFTRAQEAGIPPPQDSVKRIEAYDNFHLLASTQIQQVTTNDTEVLMLTNHGTLKADFLILATGYRVDASKVSFALGYKDDILYWNDKVEGLGTKMGIYPYLGRHFEFIEKVPGTASFLANIHCFNDAAFLSHGRICGDIDCIDVGIRRIAEGIAIDLFLQDTCRNGEPVPSHCPGSCQSGLCSPFSK